MAVKHRGRSGSCVESQWPEMVLEVTDRGAPSMITYGNVSYVPVSWRFAHAGVAQRSPTAALPATDGRLPVVIQGGMGVAVSSWQLARAVSQAGQLGVVSGTALDVVIARRLQDGDVGGHVRRALESFPVLAMAQRMMSRYFLDGGRAPKQPYHPVPKLSMDTPVAGLELSMVANFAEVWLAKEGHDGLVGINFLEKVQMATPSAAYGAMLAGVDY